MRNISDKFLDKNKTYNSMFNKFPFSQKSYLWRGNAEKFCTNGQATDDNMAHAHWMLYTSGYKHTLRIRNTYCSFTARVVTRRRLNVTFIRTLPVSLIIAPSRTIHTPWLEFHWHFCLLLCTLYEFQLKPRNQFEFCERLIGRSCTTLERKIIYFIFCWPCISLQILGSNQLDALFHVFISCLYMFRETWNK